MRSRKAAVRWFMFAGASMMAVVGLAAPASAQTDDSDVIAALEAAGLDTEQIPSELIAKVNERIDKMIDAGVLTDAQVDRVVELRETGEMDDRIAERVEAKRADRRENRKALVDRLADEGIDVGEGQSIRDALIEAGYDHDDAKELIKKLRPEHQDDDEDSDEDESDGSDDVIDEDESIDEQIDDVIDRAVDHAKDRDRSDDDDDDDDDAEKKRDRDKPKHDDKAEKPEKAHDDDKADDDKSDDDKAEKPDDEDHDKSEKPDKAHDDESEKPDKAEKPDDEDGDE